MAGQARVLRRGVVHMPRIQAASCLHSQVGVPFPAYWRSLLASRSRPSRYWKGIPEHRPDGQLRDRRGLARVRRAARRANARRYLQCGSLAGVVRREDYM
jgi:hypothetical protein